MAQTTVTRPEPKITQLSFTNVATKLREPIRVIGTTRVMREHDGPAPVWS